MNRIVLIDNGFDLAYGLNTKYEDLDLVQNISRNFTDMKLMRDRVVNSLNNGINFANEMDNTNEIEMFLPEEMHVNCNCPQQSKKF